MVHKWNTLCSICAVHVCGKSNGWRVSTEVMTYCNDKEEAVFHSQVKLSNVWREWPFPLLISPTSCVERMPLAPTISQRMMDKATRYSTEPAAEVMGLQIWTVQISWYKSQSVILKVSLLHYFFPEKQASMLQTSLDITRVAIHNNKKLYWDDCFALCRIEVFFTLHIPESSRESSFHQLWHFFSALKDSLFCENVNVTLTMINLQSIFKCFSFSGNYLNTIDIQTSSSAHSHAHTYVVTAVHTSTIFM